MSDQATTFDDGDIAVCVSCGTMWFTCSGNATCRPSCSQLGGELVKMDPRDAHERLRLERYRRDMAEDQSWIDMRREEARA